MHLIETASFRDDAVNGFRKRRRFPLSLIRTCLGKIDLPRTI